MPAEPLRLAGDRCAACGRPRSGSALDEYRWCPECRELLARRIRLGRHLVALLVVLPFGVWILFLERGAYLPLYAWLLPFGAAYYLGLRIGGEALRGYARWRRLR
ncbi:MAG: hypothetical protein ACE5HP_08665 [Gemmatimonadota bacterium]